MSEIIRAATKKLHEDLELQSFNQKMFRSEQTRDERQAYLSVQYEIFSCLDIHVPAKLRRLPYICYDLDQLGGRINVPPAALGYATHLETICEDKRPHIYLNYMGLMFGGQIMKRRYPNFPMEIYEFEDLQAGKRYIREEVCEDTDNFILEVKYGFRWQIEIAKELGMYFEVKDRIEAYLDENARNDKELSGV